MLPSACRVLILPALIVVLTSLLSAPASAVPLGGTELDRLTIPDAQRRMDDGELTSVLLTGAYLQRIRALNPRLNAVITTNPSALREAADSDLRRREGRSRGLLDGIPVLLKDNVDTATMPTTAGSRALREPNPTADATLVHRLRAAGAVVLGKANLSEWANFRAAKPTSGWSATGGQTNNPHVLDHNPCGSSSGSAAAVAASLAQVAIGSETDGSIVCPAGMTGVVGFKPSLGLVSRTGMVPISGEQDTAGPMARHVVDVAATLSVLQGRDPADDKTADYPADQSTDYASILDTSALRGARIGLWRVNLGPEVDAMLTRTVDLLREHGATVVEVNLPYQDQLARDEFPALLTEFRRDIEAYLATRPGVPQTLNELIEYNRHDPAEQTCFAGQELFEAAAKAPGADDPEYRRLRANLTDLARRSIDETMAAHHLDAIAAPTNPLAWKTDCAKGDNDVIPTSTPAAVGGYPHISVPAGFAGPLPLGLSIFGSRWSDATVLSLGAAYEQASQARKPPRYLPTPPTRP